MSLPRPSKGFDRPSRSVTSPGVARAQDRQRARETHAGIPLRTGAGLRKTKSQLACEQGSWCIGTWMRADPGTVRYWAFQCRAWRHEGACARHRSQQDFQRVMQALKPYKASELVLLVLTLDPRTSPSSLEGQFRSIPVLWERLRKMLARGISGLDAETGRGVEGFRKGFTFPGLGKFQLIRTLEEHRNGRPHLNVIVISSALAGFLRENPATESDLQAKRGPRWFRSLAHHAGFGPICSIEVARSKEAVASYVVKTEYGQPAPHPSLAGEVVKLSQLPFHAPFRMRRIQGSKGLLPPAKLPPDPAKTGKLFKHKPPEVMRAEQRAALDALAGRRRGLRVVR